MTLYLRTLTRTAAAVALAAFSAFGAAAQTGSIRVLASNGMKAVIQQLQPECERAIGHPLAITFGSTSGLKQQIEMGDPFDATFLASDAMAELVKENKVAGTADLARAGIGVAVRTGAPKPDIHSPDAMKQTLRDAASITYAENGASRADIEKMFATLGVADALKPKVVLTQGSGPAMESVASGKVAIVVTLLSELITEPGIEIVGPLPGSLQGYVSFAAAANPGAKDSQSARALIAFFKSAAAAPVYKAKGMEPR